jgi:hypothetical protein
MKTRWWLVGLGLALLVAILSPLASSHPDGLERVAEDHGFLSQAREPWYRLISDYVLPGIADARLATIISGIVGVFIAFALTYALARIIARRRPAEKCDP